MNDFIQTYERALRNIDTELNAATIQLNSLHRRIKFLKDEKARIEHDYEEAKTLMRKEPMTNP